MVKHSYEADNMASLPRWLFRLAGELLGELEADLVGLLVEVAHGGGGHAPHQVVGLQAKGVQCKGLSLCQSQTRRTCPYMAIIELLHRQESYVASNN